MLKKEIGNAIIKKERTMKKFIIFFVIVLVIVSGISYIYLNYRSEYNSSMKANMEFEKYQDVEVYGADLATIINRAVDRNEKNKVSKNNTGIYIDNDSNSISIEIKMKDNDTIYQMETIYNGGIQNFISYYSNIKFKCVDIKYHDSTHKVRYMLFEQISE